ncbi:MAG: hypothetical protein QXP70_05335, partial [Methanomassiliicoccales archaeon]
KAEPFSLNKEDIEFINASVPRVMHEARCMLFDGNTRMPLIVRCSANERRICASGENGSAYMDWVTDICGENLNELMEVFGA